MAAFAPQNNVGVFSARTVLSRITTTPPSVVGDSPLSCTSLMIGQGAPPASVRVSARRSWTALSASADNDEVEEEDGFDPLGDGIDSVS